MQAAVNFFDSASSHAESGDIDAAALLILKALDQERRALVVGPQILHLIKPISWFNQFISKILSRFELPYISI